MKLSLKDKVVVISGRDKGKTGIVTAVIPSRSMVVVENINVVKKHVKPGGKQPKGGIIDVTQPIPASRVMAIDPASGLPARIGYRLDAKGGKERIFKVSAQRQKATKSKPKTKEAK